MRIENIDLPLSTSGTTRSLCVYRFGKAEARPKIYIQASLHADEIPGMLTAVQLCNRLEALEADGKLTGEFVVVPVANPIGLAQSIQGSTFGRFALADGTNFNRHFAELGLPAAERLRGRLTNDPVQNRSLVRDALRHCVDALSVSDEVSGLRRALLRLAVDADVVLDLHCDSEAVTHLYTSTSHASRARPLAAALGARALLTAEVSGDHPFDEALSRTWLEIAKQFPQHPISHSCFATTVELRGDVDVSSALAEHDAEAILLFAAIEGALSFEGSPMSTESVPATPLAGVLPLTAPCAGIVVFERAVGELIRRDDVVARLVDPILRSETTLTSEIEGVLFARSRSRYAVAGQRLAKIAGREPIRSGKLLSP